MAGFTIRRFAGKPLGLDQSGGGLHYATDAVDVDLSHGTLRPVRRDRAVGRLPNSVGTVTSFMIEDCCAAVGEQCSSFLKLNLPCERYFRVSNGRLENARSLCGPWVELGHPCIKEVPQLLTSSVRTEGKVILKQYIYAVVNDFGEIETLSPPSTTEVGDWDRDSLVHGIVAPMHDPIVGAGDRKVRLYSTAPDLTLGPEAAPSDINFFAVNEMMYGSDAMRHSPRETPYGDALVPEEYSPPPRGLTSIASWGTRQIAGVAEGELWFSMLGNFSSWPTDARMRFDDPALAFAASQRTGYVLTCGRPVVVDLQTDCRDGRCHSATRIEEPLPLLAPRSVASFGEGVIYASELGLVYLQGTRWTLLTAGLTREEWHALNPYRMRGVIHRGNYFLATDAGTWRIHLPSNPFDPATGRATMTRLSIGVESWYRTDRGRLLYSPGDQQVNEWAEGTNFQTMSWDSEAFEPSTGIRFAYVNSSHDAQYTVEAVPFHKGLPPASTPIPDRFYSGPSWVRLPSWIDRGWWTIRVVVAWGEVTAVTLATSRTLKGAR